MYCYEAISMFRDSVNFQERQKRIPVTEINSLESLARFNKDSFHGIKQFDINCIMLLCSGRFLFGGYLNIFFSRWQMQMHYVRGK